MSWAASMRVDGRSLLQYNYHLCDLLYPHHCSSQLGDRKVPSQLVSCLSAPPWGNSFEGRQLEAGGDLLVERVTSG